MSIYRKEKIKINWKVSYSYWVGLIIGWFLTGGVTLSENELNFNLTNMLLSYLIIVGLENRKVIFNAK